MKKNFLNIKDIFNNGLLWVNSHKFYSAIVLVIFLGSLFFIVNEAILNKNEGSASNTSQGNEKQEETSEQSSAGQPKNEDQNNVIQGSRNVPFSITKVFFREYPTTPAGAEDGSCYEGQEITFPVAAEVTHTGTGVARYHWEINDRTSQTTRKYDDELITFNESGTSKIAKQLDYKAYDTSHSTGLPSPAFQTRLHMNLVFEDPNLIYANIENPVYASANFVWGNYIDLCD